MKNFVFGLAAAGLVAGAAHAQVVLATGTYKSIGTVASDNGKCMAAGLVAGSKSNSRFSYPGVSRTGFNLYTPASGFLQLCNRFPAVPATGLDGWTVTAQCAVDTVNGDIKAQPVTFTFHTTIEDKNTGIGSTTVSIPASDTVSPGCVATVATTTIVSGH